MFCNEIENERPDYNPNVTIVDIISSLLKEFLIDRIQAPVFVDFFCKNVKRVIVCISYNNRNKSNSINTYFNNKYSSFTLKGQQSSFK